MVETSDNPLDWSEPGAPRSRRFGDVYYSLEDGLAESRAVFLAGCGLPEAWRGRAHFTVAELGFGTGLNIAALLHLWRGSGARGRLHVFSIEGFPVAGEDAARALSAWPEIAGASQALLDRWPASTPGFHRIDLPDWNAVLDLAVGDAAWALQQWSGQADAWFLDGFSPALNPQMWSDAVMDGVAARSRPGARVATFTVAGAVRRGLSERGFLVHKRPGHGRKRERLEAVLPGRADDSPRRRVAVIGAGIAGASGARALAALDQEVVVIEADRPGAGASGFPAALATPRLDAGDQVLAGLFAQAMERAARLYEDVPDGVIARGVARLAKGPRDGVRFDRIAAQPYWPPGAMTRLDASALSARLGEPVTCDGLMMAGALTVRPQKILEAWLANGSMIRAGVADIERRGDAWRLLDADGAVITEAEAVITTAGWGGAALGVQGLQAVRGQAGWAVLPGALKIGAAWGGYAAPTAEGVLFGATHDRDDEDARVRPQDDARLIETLREVMPALAARVEASGFDSGAGVRAATRDRLPMAGALEPGAFVLGGLGSRGFAAAPLLGEHVAALIAGAPSPLPGTSSSRIDPLRGSLKSGR